MGDFVIGRTPVADWRSENGEPARPMADQIADLLEQFDDQKDMRSIAALTQGLRWIDESHTRDDTIDSQEWQSVRRAMRKALGEGAPVADRPQRIAQAFAEEASSGKPKA